MMKVVVIQSLSGQILCLADAILFTERCEESIREGRLTNFKKELEVCINPFTVNMVVHHLEPQLLCYFFIHLSFGGFLLSNVLCISQYSVFTKEQCSKQE